MSKCVAAKNRKKIDWKRKRTPHSKCKAHFGRASAGISDLWRPLTSTRKRHLVIRTNKKKISVQTGKEDSFGQTLPYRTRLDSGGRSGSLTALDETNRSGGWNHSLTSNKSLAMIDHIRIRKMEREGAAATTTTNCQHISGVPFISYSQSIPNSFVSFCRQFICHFRSFRDFLAVADIPNMERMFANQNKSAIKRARQEEKWPVMQEIEPSKDLNISFDSYGFYFSTSCRCLS